MLHDSPKAPFWTWFQSEFEALFESRWFVAIFLFFCHFWLSLRLLLKPMQSEVDAYGRYEAATKVLYSPLSSQLSGSVWLPLNQFILALALFFFPDSQLAPRVLTWAFASVIPFLIFLLTKHITHRNMIAIATALAYVSLPFFTEISTATLTEPVFLSLFLTSLYCFLTRRWWIWGVTLILSQALRFEAWFVIPIFGFVIFTDTLLSPLKKTLLLGTLVLFPLFYSVCGWFFANNATAYYSEMSDYAEKAWLNGFYNWPVAVSDWATLLPKAIPLIYLAVIGLGAWKFTTALIHQPNNPHLQSQLLCYVAVPSLLFLILPIQVFLQLRDWLPVRYFLIPLTCSFPLLGYGLQQLVRIVPITKFLLLYSLVGLFLLFELRSQQLNIKSVISNISFTDFDYINKDLSELKTLLEGTKNPQILLYDAKQLGEKPPLMQTHFFTYFLLPVHPSVTRISEAEIGLYLQSKPDQEKILVIENTQVIQLKERFQLTPLITSKYFSYLVAESSPLAR